MGMTTLTADFRRPNYYTLPTIDVEIIPPSQRVLHCEKCGDEVEYRGSLYTGKFFHKTDPEGLESPSHYAAPRPTCYYCGSDESVGYVAYAYYDSFPCGRCGGASARPLGD